MLDKHNQPIQPGDDVVIRGRITEVFDHEGIVVVRTKGLNRSLFIGREGVEKETANSESTAQLAGEGHGG